MLQRRYLLGFNEEVDMFSALEAKFRLLHLNLLHIKHDNENFSTHITLKGSLGCSKIVIGTSSTPKCRNSSCPAVFFPHSP